MQELLQHMRAGAAHLTVGDKIWGGVVVAIFSMLIVFMVLVLLMYVIKVMGMAAGQKKETKAAPSAPAAPAAVATVPTVSVQDESEVIAAVMAAVNCMSASEGSRIVIKNIVKKQDNWGNAGLLEQINNRL